MEDGRLMPEMRLINTLLRRPKPITFAPFFSTSNMESSMSWLIHGFSEGRIYYIRKFISYEPSLTYI